jgi:hypothetical protein
MKNSKNLREFEQMAVDLGFNPLSFLPFENDLGWRLLVSCPKTNCRYYGWRCLI